MILLICLHSMHESLIDKIKTEDDCYYLPSLGNGLFYEETHPYLENNPLNINNSKYVIIGTFPPVSYIADKLTLQNGLKQNDNKDVKKPCISFFHGNKNTLWKLLNLKSVQNNLKLNRDEIKNSLIEELKQNQIYYSDILSKIYRKEWTSDDAKLCPLELNHELVDLVFNIENEVSLQFNTSNVFNSKGLDLFYKNKVSKGCLQFDKYKNYKLNSVKSFELFLIAAIVNGYTVSLSKELNDDNYGDVLSDYSKSLQLKYKNTAAVKMKLTKDKSKCFKVLTGPSPSSSNRRKGLILNHIGKDGKKKIYTCFLKNDWECLFNLNNIKHQNKS